MDESTPSQVNEMNATPRAPLDGGSFHQLPTDTLIVALPNSPPEQTSGFLRLAVEIRLIIYEYFYALTKGNKLMISLFYELNRLRRVCRILDQEVREFSFQIGVIQLHHSDLLSRESYIFNWGLASYRARDQVVRLRKLQIDLSSRAPSQSPNYPKTFKSKAAITFPHAKEIYVRVGEAIDEGDKRKARPRLDAVLRDLERYAVRSVRLRTIKELRESLPRTRYSYEQHWAQDVVDDVSMAWIEDKKYFQQ